MLKERNLTGLLLIFIGLIIGIFVGFGFILTLVGTFMIAKENDYFRLSRNAFIGTLATSIASFFVIIGVGGLAGMTLGSHGRNGAIGALVGVIIAMVAILITLCVFNINAYTNLMLGCKEIALEEKNTELADNCDKTKNHYKRAIIIATIAIVLFSIFILVPILNVFLLLFVIGASIYNIIAQIMIIIRVWQTYDKYKG